MKSVTIFATLSIAALGACSKPNSTTTTTTDSTSRATPTDVAASAQMPPETVFVTTARAPAPRRAPRPVEPAPAPAPPPAGAAPQAPPRGPRILDAGTDIPSTLIDGIHSGYNGPGEPIRATVNSDMLDQGRVVIPAGSVVTFRINAIGPATSRGEKATLDMTAESVEINGRRFPLHGSATDYDFELKGRPVNAGDVATAAGGAAIGAIIGRVIGGKTGTIVGAIGGGAAGTAVAAKNVDRDIIIKAGTPITVVLLDPFER